MLTEHATLAVLEGVFGPPAGGAPSGAGGQQRGGGRPAADVEREGDASAIPPQSSASSLPVGVC